MNRTAQGSTCFQLIFRSLHREGHGFSFPCDPRGQVVLDQLSDRARTSYLYARATVGREFLFPVVRAAA